MRIRLTPPNRAHMTTLKLQHHVETMAEPTERTLQVAVMFGLSLDATHRHTIIPPIEVPLAPGQIVFITGVSGGGKSTLLRLIKKQLIADSGLDNDKPVSHRPPELICADALPPLPESALVEALARPEVAQIKPGKPGQANKPADLDQVCHWLSQAGLNDAAVMLRTPSQLSVGQRHRLQLAQAIAVAHRADADWSVLLADEFASSLDRTTAHALARSTRKWVTRSNICLVAATAHDDLLEPLSPDVLVELSPGGQCEIHTRHR